MRNQLTVASAFEHRVSASPHAIALETLDTNCRVRRIAWQTLKSRVQALSEALMDAGVKPGDRVGAMMDDHVTCVEVFLAFVNLHATSAIVEPFRGKRRIAQHFKGIRPRVVLVSSGPQQVKFEGIRNELDFEHRLVVVDDAVDSPDSESYKNIVRSDRCFTASCHEPHNAARNRDATDPVAIFCTSGTTSGSRSVTLSHRNLMAQYENTLVSQKPSNICVLCVSAPAGLIHISSAIQCIVTGSTLAALDFDGAPSKISSFAPHLIVSVPALYEAILKEYLQISMDRQLSLRDYLGGRIAYCVSTGGTVSARLQQTFRSQGVPLKNAYGMTEAAGVICPDLHLPSRGSFGGRVLPTFEVKIAEDGEILLKGPQLISEYWNDPLKTREAFTSDGWFRTGDIGFTDDGGNLYLSGRKKDLIINNLGDLVATPEIEGHLRMDMYIDDVCVLGENRPYLTAIVVPSKVAVIRWAELIGITPNSYRRLLGRKEVREFYRSRISEILKDFDPIEQVRDFILVPQPFSVADGTLTGTLKIRRTAVEVKYRKELEAMYPSPVCRTLTSQGC